MEGEASGQDTQVAPENGKSEKVASLEFQKRPSDNLIWPQWNLFQIYELWSGKRIGCSRLKLLSLWSFFTEAIGH